MRSLPIAPGGRERPEAGAGRKHRGDRAADRETLRDRKAQGKQRTGRPGISGIPCPGWKPSSIC